MSRQLCAHQGRISMMKIGKVSRSEEEGLDDVRNGVLCRVARARSTRGAHVSHLMGSM